MSEISDAARPAVTSLRRLWWLPVLLALVAGTSAYVTSSPASATTYGIVNTRTISALPNDRLDLINDLSSVFQLPSVLQEPALIADMSVDELRQALLIERIESTTLARITFTSDVDDAETNQEVLSTLVANAASFLTQTAEGDAKKDVPSAQLQVALDAEVEASEAVADSVRQNFGVEPDAKYTALQGQLFRNPPATPEGRADLARRLKSAYEDSRDYRRLLLQQSRASETVSTLQMMDLEQNADQANLRRGIPLSFEGAVASNGDTVARVRRSLAAAAAGALLGAFLAVLIGRRRSSRPA